jgi:hypothetical protein
VIVLVLTGSCLALHEALSGRDGMQNKGEMVLAAVGRKVWFSLFAFSMKLLTVMCATTNTPTDEQSLTGVCGSSVVSDCDALFEC